ncbi:p194 [Agapanthus tungrovirus]|uniref:p194 n=1 Tax=Agapanthus tungrovirus TaxID=2838078 RepID=A0A8E7KMA7_9VIRU|nr:p194 [Agapanthus tungrovirus]
MSLNPFTGNSRTLADKGSSSSDKGLQNKTSKGKQKILEEEVDVDETLAKFDLGKIKTIPKNEIYKHNWFDSKEKIFQAYREDALEVTNNSQLISIISDDTIKRMKTQNQIYCHIGLIAIGIKGLHRKKIGARTLVTLLDLSWQNMDEAIFGAIEMDMNVNYGIFFCVPDFQKEIKDMSKIKIGIQTHGYESYEGKNLTIYVNFIGRLSTRMHSKFKIKATEIVEQIASKGIQMIRPMLISSEKFDGEEWKLDQFRELENSARIPDKMLMYKNYTGGTSLRFSDYKNKYMKNPDDDKDSDEDDIPILGMFQDHNEWMKHLNDVVSDSEDDDEYLDYNLAFEQMKIEEDNGWNEISDEELELDISTEKLFEPLDNILGKKSVQETVDDIFLELLNIHGNTAMAEKVLNERIHLDKIELVEQNKIPIEDLFKQHAKSGQEGTSSAITEGNNYDTEMRDDWSRKPYAPNRDKYNPDNENYKFKGLKRWNYKPRDSIVLNLDNVNIQYWREEVEHWEGIVKNEWEARKTPGMDMWSWMDGRLSGLISKTFRAYKVNQPNEYQTIVNRGDRPENFVKIVKDLLFLVDPSEDDTLTQRLALRELEALKCDNPKFITEYLRDFLRLINNANLLYDNTVKVKIFDKLPGDLGNTIKQAYLENRVLSESLPTTPATVMANYIVSYMRDKCKQEVKKKQEKKAALQFCQSIVTPESASYNKKSLVKRKRVDPARKSKFVKKPSNRKCKCYVCGDFSHLANNCPKRADNRSARAALIAGLDDDIVSLDGDENENEIYEIISDLNDEFEDFIACSGLSEIQHVHTWTKGGNLSKKCYQCKLFSTLDKTIWCEECKQQICSICAKEIDLQTQEEAEVNLTIKELKQMVLKHDAKIALIEHKLNMPDLHREFNLAIQGNAAEEASAQNPIVANTIKVKNITTACYVDCRVELFGKVVVTKGFIDSGSTYTLICPKLVPKEWIRTLPYAVTVTTIDNRQFNINQGLHLEAKIRFKEVDDKYGPSYDLGIVYISNEPINQIFIGWSFISKDKGGMYLSRDYIQIYRNVGIFPTITHTLRSECDQNRGGNIPPEFPADFPLKSSFWKPYQKIPANANASIDLLPKEISPTHGLFKRIKDLETLGFLGDDITKCQSNWVCKFKVLNPDIKITCKGIDETPADKEEFRKQIAELLNQGLIYQAKPDCRHRSAAFIVRNHSEEKRGKARIVYNYKRLNDNMETDPFNLPHKNSLMNLIQGAKVFSKFDLKSGFHQMKLEEWFQPWTTFTCSVGLYTWKVCPFGIANAPCAFQRFMQDVFGHLKFCLVYIDDILVMSKSRDQHKKHLLEFFDTVKNNGIVLSKKKTELFKEEIDYLGLKINKGKIELQPHISQKILTFDKKTLESKKGLQSYLGLLNYARPFFKDLSKLIKPLYSKTGKNGQSYFNQEDWKLIDKIENQVRNLPTLKMANENDYIVIETDASESGWGAVVYAKPTKLSPKSSEEIIAYASGKFLTRPTWTSLDYEIEAIVKSLEKFKTYLNKDFTIRTDCEAIVKALSEFKNTKGFTAGDTNKRSRIRWIRFKDNLLIGGYQPTFESIKGEKNFLANILSREFAGKQQFIEQTEPELQGQISGPKQPQTDGRKPKSD